MKLLKLVIQFSNLAQIDQEGIGYFNDESTQLLNRCLPDNPRYDDSGAYDPAGAYLKLSESIFFDSLGASITGPDEIDYIYLGYINRLINLYGNFLVKRLLELMEFLERLLIPREMFHLKKTMGLMHLRNSKNTFRN